MSRTQLETAVIEKLFLDMVYTFESDPAEKFEFLEAIKTASNEDLEKYLEN